jgi:hypothetical protein
MGGFSALIMDQSITDCRLKATACTQDTGQIEFAARFPRLFAHYNQTLLTPKCYDLLALPRARSLPVAAAPRGTEL